MTRETSKAVERRSVDKRFAEKYIVGEVIDIGAGADGIGAHKNQFPKITNVKDWDLPDGDAMLMANASDNTYDCVHSSHCLEHMVDPVLALENWIRIAKPGGYIVVLVPEEDLYEQGFWPSRYNGDHKHTWTIAKNDSWSPVSINVVNFLYQFLNHVEIIKIELIDHNFDYSKPQEDQTLGISESAIEFVLRKK
jgi:ubiquinone/menaquinone biosynthesis C-methylase UbiE